MATIATLAVNLIGNVSGLKSALGEAQGAIRATADKMSSMGRTMSVSVTAPLVGFGLAALKGAAEQEQLQVAFSTMLGSAEKANTLIQELSDFSASTPFQMPEVVGAGKQLLAFGVAAEGVQPALTKLGDLAAGVGAPIGDLAYLYGTAKAQGRLFMADVNQFSSRGIPMIEALSATMGVAQSDVRKLIEEGKVGFPEMDAAINHLTGTGSKFGGLMEAQSATLAGMFSTLQDTVGLSLTAIGAQMVETFDLKTLLGGDKSLPDDSGGILGYLGRVKDAIINFAKTQPQMFKLAAIFLAAAAALGPLLIGLGFVMNMLASAIPVITALGGAFGFLLGPIGLVIGAIAALVYFDVGGIRAKLAGIGEWFGKLFNVLKTGEFKKLGGLLVSLGMGREQAYALAAAVGNLVHTVEDLFAALVQGDMNAFVQALGISEEQITAMGAAIAATRDAFKTFLAGADVATFSQDVVSGFTTVKNAFADLFSGEISLGDFAGKISEVLSGIPTTVRNLFGGADFAALKSQVVAALGLDNISFEGVLASLATFGENLATTITNFDYAGSFESLKTTVTSAFDSIDWSPVTTTFESLKTTVTDALGGIDWAGSIESIKEKANGLRDGLLAAITDKINETDWGGLSLDFAGMIDWITGKINEIDWSSISIEDIGVALAGVILPTLTNAVKTISWVVSSDNWSGLVTAVQNALSAIEWGEIGTSLLGLVTAVGNGIASMDWSTLTTGFETLKTSVSEAFANIDWSGIATGFVTTANGIRDDLLASLTTTFTEMDLTASISGVLTSLTTAIQGIDFASLGETLGTAVSTVLSPESLKAAFDIAVATVAPALVGSIAAITWVMDSENFSGLATSVKGAIDGINWGTVSEKFTSLKAAISDGWTEFTGGFMKTAGIEPPDWAAILTWPDGITAPDWTTLLVWPEITWPGWETWIKWPDIVWPGWTNLVKFPSIDAFPGWSALFAGVTSSVGGALNNLNPFGANATGTGFWQGGLTWVGERGPELVDLPRGSQVFSNQDSLKLMKEMAEAKKIGALAEGTTSLGQAMQNVSPIWRPSKGQLTAGELVPKLNQMVTTQIVKPLESAAKKLSDSIGTGADDLRDALRSTPGLFSTSQVTQKQMDMAALGVNQRFADKWIRELSDSVLNGVKWEGVDIRDAAMRAGIDPNLPAQVILEMVKEKWNDQSFFANKDNLELLNLDAIKAEQERLAASKLGEQNLLSFLGIPADQVQGQGVAVGTSLRTGITQGIAGAGGGAGMGSTLVSDLTGDITPKTMAPVAGKLMDSISAVLSSGDAALTANFGSAFATLINDQLEKENPFAETGAKVLSKITESWASLTQSATDLITPLADAMNVQLDSQSVIEALMDVGARMVKIVFAGFDEEALGLNWVGSVQTAATSGGSVSLPGNALGTQYWRGGATWVGERGPELVMAPRGAQIVPNGRAQAMAGSDGKIVIENFHARSEGDVISFAYQVDDLQRRRRRR